MCIILRHLDLFIKSIAQYEAIFEGAKLTSDLITHYEDLYDEREDKGKAKKNDKSSVYLIVSI